MAKTKIASQQNTWGRRRQPLRGLPYKELSGAKLMSSPCSQRPQRRRQHASLSGRTDSSAKSDEETKAANERRRRTKRVCLNGGFSHYELQGYSKRLVSLAKVVEQQHRERKSEKNLKFIVKDLVVSTSKTSYNQSSHKNFSPRRHPNVPMHCRNYQGLLLFHLLGRKSGVSILRDDVSSQLSCHFSIRIG